MYLVFSAFTSTPISVLASAKRYSFSKRLCYVILGLVPFTVHLKAQGPNTTGMWPHYRKRSPKGAFT